MHAPCPGGVKTRKRTGFSPRPLRVRNLLRNSELVALLRLAHGCRKRRDDLQGIADDPVVGDLENRSFLVAVYRDDGLRRSHAGEMLNRAGNADGNIQLWTDRSASLPDLIALRTPAVV